MRKEDPSSIKTTNYLQHKYISNNDCKFSDKYLYVLVYFVTLVLKGLISTLESVRYYPKIKGKI